MLDCKAKSDFLHLIWVWLFQCSLQLGMHCQYLCGDMLAVEKWTSLLETRKLEVMPLGESIQRLRANNNRCIRFSSKAHKIREHLMLHLCIQALIHSHMSPFQRRHLSESWQQIRHHPLTSHWACLLLIKPLIFFFFLSFPAGFHNINGSFWKWAYEVEVGGGRPGFDTSLSDRIAEGETFSCLKNTYLNAYRYVMQQCFHMILV